MLESTNRFGHLETSKLLRTIEHLDARLATHDHQLRLAREMLASAQQGGVVRDHPAVVDRVIDMLDELVGSAPGPQRVSASTTTQPEPDRPEQPEQQQRAASTPQRCSPPRETYATLTAATGAARTASHRRVPFRVWHCAACGGWHAHPWLEGSRSAFAAE